MSELPEITVQQTSNGFKVSIPRYWIDNHPLTEFSLNKEAEDWLKIDKELKIDFF
jgi:exopolyphosphatase/guanosine-5'-triphosphate,3'-diphosphate pyrophosphatase